MYLNGTCVNATAQADATNRKANDARLASVPCKHFMWVAFFRGCRCMYDCEAEALAAAFSQKMCADVDMVPWKRRTCSSFCVHVNVHACVCMWCACVCVLSVSVVLCLLYACVYIYTYMLYSLLKLLSVSV